MRFFNETTLADVTDASVDVVLLDGNDELSSLSQCRTFLLSGRLWVDCAPEQCHKYTAPVPENVVISRNEGCLALGRFGLFVPVGSSLGNLVTELLDVAKRKAAIRVQEPSAEIAM